MKKASTVWTSVFGTLASDFVGMVKMDLYDYASKNPDYAVEGPIVKSLSKLCETNPELRAFVAENTVPACTCEFRLNQEYGTFGIYIDGKLVEGYPEDPRNGAVAARFDWDVSDEVAEKHTDDYEISKDEMYDYGDTDMDVISDEENMDNNAYWEEKYSQYFVA